MISRAEVVRRPYLRIPALVAGIWIVTVTGILLSGLSWELFSGVALWSGWKSEFTLWIAIGPIHGWGPAVVGATVVEIARRRSA